MEEKPAIELFIRKKFNTRPLALICNGNHTIKIKTKNQMLEITDKQFRTTIINVFRTLRKILIMSEHIQISAEE